MRIVSVYCLLLASSNANPKGVKTLLKRMRHSLKLRIFLAICRDMVSEGLFLLLHHSPPSPTGKGNLRLGVKLMLLSIMEGKLTPSYIDA